MAKQAKQCPMKAAMGKRRLMQRSHLKHDYANVCALRALHGYGGVWEILHLPLLPAPTVLLCLDKVLPAVSGS